MGTKTSIGLVLALILVVLAMVLRFGIADKGKIEAAQKAAEQGASAQTKQQNKQALTQTLSPPLDKTKGIAIKHPHTSANTTGIYNPLDHMTPEMKQALRDQLLQHGPKETFTKNDGTVVLPSGGRATQVSVAVMMPDGSVQIREYSEIPDEQAAPSFTMSEPTK